MTLAGETNLPDRMDLVVCLDCGTGVTRGGACPQHPEEPLFDPLDLDVQFEMQNRDTSLKHKVHGFWSGLGIAIGMIYGLPLGAFYFPADVHGTRTMLIMAMLFGSPAMALGNFIGRKRYRPKFSAWLRARRDHADPEDLAAVTSNRDAPWWTRFLG
jgi:hypothetical protein